MHRLTISLDATLATAFDEFAARHGYQNRSEAVRDLIRDRLEQERLEHQQGQYCVASVSYVYNHHERELASRLTDIQHAHHDLSLSTMHVHLDHDECLETVVLRGRLDAVRRFADALVAERGVRHGKIHLIPVERQLARSAAHPHVHYRSRS